MNKPRDHHFIPVFYLKQWTNGDGKLVEYSRPYRSNVIAKTVGPRSTGFQRDLYSFPDSSPEIAHYLEAEFLQRTDSLAADALRIHLSRDKLEWTDELRSAWSRFVINFLIRHPHPFAEIKAATRSNWLKPDDLTQKQYEELRSAEDPATFEEWISTQDDLSDKMIIALLQAAMDNEIVGERINSLNWNVLDLSTARYSLLTSDWPLYKEVESGEFLFMLPISPTALFTAVSNTRLLRKLMNSDPTALVRHMNITVTSAARLYVYSTDRSQDRLIQNRMSSNMVQPPFFPSLTKSD